MSKFVFKFDCKDNHDRSLVASFPHGIVEIEKENLDEAMDWFVGFLFTMFDQFTKDDETWRLKLFFAECDGTDCLSEAMNWINKNGF